MVRLQLFGSPHIEVIGAPLSQLRSRKIEALLYYLAVMPGQHRRLHLANLLWSESPEATALSNLRYALWNLRQNLPQVPLLAERLTITFQPTTTLWVDVNEFQAGMKGINSTLASSENVHSTFALSEQKLSTDTVMRLQQATDLYHGEFLAGFDLTDAPSFEEWLQWQRTTLHNLALDSFTRLGSHYAALAQWPEAITATQRLLKLEPWQEIAHRRMMLYLTMIGRRDAALAHYQHCREILAAELDVEPEPGTQALMEQIRTGQLVSETAHPITILPQDKLLPAKLSQPNPAQTDVAPIHIPTLPLCGREREYGWLLQQWIQATQGQSGLVLLRGEAGVGKTRLVEEVSRHIIIQGGIMLRGRCYEFSDPLPYQPIAAALQSQIALLKAKDCPLSDVWVAELAQLLPEVRRQPDHRSSLPPAQVGSDRYRLFEAVAQLLQVITVQQPVLFFLDDLQWADTDTLDLVGYLVRRLTASSLLIIGAYRPGEVINDHALVALQRPGYNEGLDQELCLDQLSIAAVQQLVQITTPVTTCPILTNLPTLNAVTTNLTTNLTVAATNADDSLTRFLYEISQGNPFILLETLQEMHERGWLHAVADSRLVLQLPAQSCLMGAELAIQDGLHLLCSKDAPCQPKNGISRTKRYIGHEQTESEDHPLRQGNLILSEVKNRIRRRIARLVPNSQQLLSMAAIIGHPFEIKLLQVAGALSPTVAVDYLEDWIERGLVREVSPQTQHPSGADLLPQLSTHRYDFNHDLIRAVVYHDLSQMRRQAIHLQVGVALEHLYAGQIEKIIEWLAHHYHCGYEPQKALLYLQQAGRQAQEIYALPTALDHYQQALTYWEQLYNTRGGHVPTDAWRQRWDLLLSQAEVSRMLGQLKKQPAGLETVAEEVTHWGDDRDRLRVLSQQLARLEHSPDLDQRRKLAQEGLLLARQLDDALAEGNCLQASAECNRDMALHSEALTNYNAALNKFSQAKQTRQIAFCLIGMGKIHLFNHRFGQALSHFEEAARDAQAAGYQDALIGALNATATMYLFLGNLEGALASSQKVLTLCEKIGFDSGAAVGLVTQGYVQMLLGNLPQARTHFERAWAINLEMDQSLRMADVQCCLGHLCLLEQAYAQALAHFKRAETFCGNFYYGRAIEARSYRAIAHLALGEWKEALVCSHHAVVWLIGREHAMLAPQRIYWNQYQALLAQGEPEEAQEALVKAHRVVVNQLDNLAGAYPTTVDNTMLREQFFIRLPWNEEIMTMWDMLPLSNSHVALHFLHGYPG